MDGFLLVDKPIGMTSHDIVARVRGVLRTVASQYSTVASRKKLGTKDYRLVTPSAKPKVGHTGTLDPLATGLMILVIGSYCKRASEFSKLDKTYEVELTLGATSTTGDTEGHITSTSDKHNLNRIQRSLNSVPKITEVLKTFIGEIKQVPPAYSAIKVGGQRAYKLARQGKPVKIEPRKVMIYEIRSTIYEYPKLCFTARVSSGTYIRSLAEDIGKKLGTGAYVSALRRTKVGGLNIENALEIDKFSLPNIENHLQK
ncbi:tRNA pseudouridine(55) synthase TruB [Candidatus Saccharibacteria bacterium]|nr:tRNA pseudouridine(55) synthase TruB [Candidatus Saccharibacteria bacterium]